MLLVGNGRDWPAIIIRRVLETDAMREAAEGGNPSSESYRGSHDPRGE